VTARTVTAPAACPGIDGIVRLVLLTLLKQFVVAPSLHGTSVVTVPALNWAEVPISIAVVLVRFVPVSVALLPPPAAPLVGLIAVSVGADGSVPAGAVLADAGLASLEETEAVLPFCTVDWVTLLPVTTPFTVIEPLVNGLVVLVQEMVWPLGAPQVQPVPKALTGSTPDGSVSVIVTGWFSVAPLWVAVTV
jgi:hypothetical protein